MYISLRVHLKESCYKVTACICHCVDISRNAVTKLGSVNITACTAQEKLLQSYGTYMSLRVHLKKSRYKVTECIYYCVYS